MDDKPQGNLNTEIDAGSCRYTHTTSISAGCNEADSIYEEITEQAYEMVAVGCSDYEAPPTIELEQQNDSTYTVMK